jgi:hypothetical protein
MSVETAKTGSDESIGISQSRLLISAPSFLPNLNG